jgi:hypothetical protein
MTAAEYTPDMQPPHCDQSVLHAAGECTYCDHHPDWQALRMLWGIAFTGHWPLEHEVPCPSDQRRGTGQAHVWGGNQPKRIATPLDEDMIGSAMYGRHRLGRHA